MLFLNLMAICFKTCLLIDDNYIDNFVTRKILESGNFAEKIVVVGSATDAIGSLRNGSLCPMSFFWMSGCRKWGALSFWKNLIRSISISQI